MVDVFLVRLFSAVAVGAVLDGAPDRLARLAERPSELPCDSRRTLNLVAEAAVCVVRLGGSFTGRVGDFTLGLTKPVLLGDASNGGGFFAAGLVEVVVEGVAGFAVLIEARGV
jgi:hypothetical protein